MDNFSWDMNPATVARNSNFILPSSVWSNCEIFPGCSTVEDSSCGMNEKMELNPPLLSSIVDLHVTTPHAAASIFSNGVAEMAAPSLCSLNSTLDLDLFQYRELMTRLTAADSAPLMKSPLGATPPRGHNIRPQLHANFAPASGPKIGSPASCLTENFVPPTANNEDDLSAIFYSCETVRNLSCSANLSSGESELNHGSLDQLHQHSGREEVASGISSNPDCPPHAKPSKGLIAGVKRKIGERTRSTGECDRIRDVLQPKASAKGGGGIQISFSNDLNMSKKARKTSTDQKQSSCLSSIDFGRDDSSYEPDMEAIAQVKEMIYRAAALRPVNLGMDEPVERPKRKNVKISSDPQTVAARHRRERISERLRVLQRLVPGGSKLDTASMLDEAANYLKFLKSQVRALETLGNSSNNNRLDMAVNTSAPAAVADAATSPFPFPLNNQAFPMQHLYHSQKP